MGCGSSTKSDVVVRVDDKKTRRIHATGEGSTINQQTHETNRTTETLETSKALHHGETVSHQTTQRSTSTQQQSNKKNDDREEGTASVTETKCMIMSEGKQGVEVNQQQATKKDRNEEQNNGNELKFGEDDHERIQRMEDVSEDRNTNARVANTRVTKTKCVIISEEKQSVQINQQQDTDKGRNEQQSNENEQRFGEEDHEIIQRMEDVSEDRNTNARVTKTKVNDLLLNHREWVVEDTFWAGKKRVIKDFNRIRMVDKHAIDTTSSLKENSQQLVTYLVSISQNNLEKYRVICRWIAHHIESDTSRINEEPQIEDDSPETILKNGKGQDFSRLYNYLCQLAGLECITISGTSKGLGYDPGEELGRVPHDGSWNHIKIEGEWFVCECKWAAGHVERDQETGKYKYVKQWTEAWFLADPKTSDASHLPLNQDDVNTAALMYPLSYKAFAEWNNEPQKKPGYFIYKTQCITHDHAVIETENNEVEIRLKCFYPMEIFTTMKMAKVGDVKPLDLPKEREYDRCVVRYFRRNEVVVIVRLPSMGDYIVGVCGYAHGISEEVRCASGNFIVGYRIRGLSNAPCSLFPEKKGDIYGASWDLQLAGIHVVRPEEPIIESENGKATIELDRGASENSLVFGYYHESDPSTKLNQYIYPETIGNKIRLNLSCPKAGMYSCVVYCKFNDSDETDNTHNFGGQFVISCPEADPNARAFPSDSHGLWGSNEFLHKLGIKVSESLTTSTIYTDNDGKGSIEFLVPEGISTRHNLVNTKGENIGDTCLYAETTAQSDGSRAVNLQIRCPEVGYYRLVLFGNVESESTYNFCGRWMVICNKSYSGQPFPESSGLWGPNSHFHTLGLEIKSPLSSTINTQEGKGQLQFIVPDGIKTTHNLINAKGETVQNTYLYAETTANRDQPKDVTLYIRCSEVGYFRLVVYGNVESESTNSYCGQWMVISSAHYYGQLFPEGHGLWGPNTQFHNLGIEIILPISSTIVAHEGEGELRFLVPKGIATRHKMMNANGEDVIASSLYAETKAKPDQSREVTLHIKCPEIGCFRLVLFGDNENESSFSYCGQWMVKCSTQYRGMLFPESKGLWGPNAHSHTLGLHIVSPTSSTIQTYEGEARLIVYLEMKDFLASKFLHGLFYDNKRVENEKQHIYAMVSNHNGTFMNITYNIKVDKKGYYKLTTWGDPHGCSTYKETGQWLVRCKVPSHGQLFPEEHCPGSNTDIDNVTSEVVSSIPDDFDKYIKKGRRLMSCEVPFNGELFPEEHGLWGSNSHFRELGLEVVSPTSSSLETSEGKAKLTLCIKANEFHDITLMHGLFLNNVQLDNDRRCIMADVTTKQEMIEITYNVKLFKPGYYKFIMWGNPKGSKTNAEAGVWMINCNHPCQNEEPYPENWKPWGPNDEFRKLGLSVTEPNSSTLQAVDGKCCLVISSLQKIHTAYALKTADGKELDSVSSKQNSDGTSIELTIEVEQPGYYSFDLFASKTSGSMPWVGNWLVVMCEKKE